ncbi:unnamed protein product [Sympodiomycopsis kandeliae]
MANSTINTTQTAPGRKRAGRISRWTATFLRLALTPVLLFGVPAWPFLAISCAIPIISLATIPLFLLLSLLLLYSISWFTYLVLAQADAPSLDTGRTRFLPFLPYSPSKCVKVTWATVVYSATALRLALPAALDWSYRRVMVLGTAAGSAVVKEGILYGSPSQGKRLDVYLPPARSTRHRQDPSSRASTMGRSNSIRSRKHSTLFSEPPPANIGPDGRIIPDEEESFEAAHHSPRTPNRQPQRGAPVIVFIPSSIPPIPWTGKRKLYLQLALRFRRMGYCVIVPDITFFPEGKVKESIVDVRLVLRWVGDHISRYGGDPDKIHLMGHGLSAHLALLTLTQEAVVLSLQGVLDLQAERDRRNALLEEQWQQEEDERKSYHRGVDTGHHSPPQSTKVPGSASPDDLSGPSSLASAFESRPTRHAKGGGGHSSAEHDAWVDEPAHQEGQEDADVDVDMDAPGMAMPATPVAGDSSNKTTRRLATELAQGGVNVISFPNASTEDDPKKDSEQHHGAVDESLTSSSLVDIPIPNGLRRVEIYGSEIEIPSISGLILLSGLSDVIKAFRYESSKGIEDLSILRRSLGPSHTQCLLHSPAHLLYASKNLLDCHLLPPKILLIHGGKDLITPIEQSTLLKTLLIGIGVQHVKLRAYRSLGHVESLASLFLGVGSHFKSYFKLIAQDLQDFIDS